MSAAVRAVERYVLEIYNAGRVDLVREICADPVVRHDPGAPARRTAMSHDEQVERITRDLATHDPQFTIVHLVGDDEIASLTWEATRRSTGDRLCGIEIFRVRDGRVTDVWNAPYAEGAWS